MSDLDLSTFDVEIPNVQTMGRQIKAKEEF